MLPPVARSPATQSNSHEAAQAVAYSFGAGGERAMGAWCPGSGASRPCFACMLLPVLPSTGVQSSKVGWPACNKHGGINQPRPSPLVADESLLKYPTSELHEWLHLAAGGQRPVAATAALAALRRIAVFGTE